MKILQKWFDRLAGVSQGELDRIALAAGVFGKPGRLDLASLEKPACWRRGHAPGNVSPTHRSIAWKSERPGSMARLPAAFRP